MMNRFAQREVVGRKLGFNEMAESDGEINMAALVLLQVKWWWWWGGGVFSRICAGALWSKARWLMFLLRPNFLSGTFLLPGWE